MAHEGIVTEAEIELRAWTAIKKSVSEKGLPVPLSEIYMSGYSPPLL